MFPDLSLPEFLLSEASLLLRFPAAPAPLDQSIHFRGLLFPFQASRFHPSDPGHLMPAAFFYRNLLSSRQMILRDHRPKSLHGSFLFFWLHLYLRLPACCLIHIQMLVETAYRILLGLLHSLLSCRHISSVAFLSFC